MDLESKRTKWFLAVGGSAVGLLFGLIVAKTVLWLRGGQVPAGAQYENLEEFRRAMLDHDERDVKADDSVSLRSIIEPDDSDLIIYHLRPNLNVRFEGVPVKTNSFGMRNREISKKKPDGTYRIALLGDSFAFGWGVEFEKIFAQVMERQLNLSAAANKNFEVLDFGVPGYSSFQEAALFEKIGLDFEPDAILIYFIENDFGLPFFIKNFNSDGKLVNNIHFAELKNESEDTDAEAGHHELLRNLDANRAIRKLAERCEERGIKVYLVVNPGKNFEKTSRRLEKLKKSSNVQMLSIRERVKSMIEERGLSGAQLRLPTDPHPNAIKHEILGQALAEVFSSFIPQEFKKANQS